MKFFILIFVLNITWLSLFSQECGNIKAEFDNRKVYIYYDLAGNENETYFVSANCSKDGFKETLKYVSGAAGRNIKPGKTRMIIWDCKKEFDQIDLAQIDFKVSASTTAPANYYTVTITGKIKRGNKINITWLSGSSGEDITIDLLKKGNYYKRVVNTLDMGSFEWTIPGNVEKGEGYQIRVTTPQKNELFSNWFEMK
ncbi:MAG: hypothetical protein HY840_13150 [Bacteroidetes bacterium]|nr:hypothetical protein [Bacteroidota bacterium]